MYPYIKTGGLADVVGALSAALAARGHEVTVFLPAYRAVLESPLAAGLVRTGKVTVRMGVQDMSGEIYTLKVKPGLTLQLVGRDEFFDRSHLYWNGERDYDDNDARFIFFAKAVIEVLRAQGQAAAGAGELAPPVDIVHCHDWQTGMLPVLLRHAEQRSGVHLADRTVFTVHNMIYQGVFPRRSFALTNLHESLNAMEGLEYYGQISALKAGLMYADRVTTVSPNYAREIQLPAHAYGLDGVVRLRGAAVRGIRNGIDTAIWNPATDALLAEPFDANNLAGKAADRAALLRHFGWPADFGGPIFCIISRMTQAKGHDLLLGAVGFFRKNGCRLVVLGSGEPKFEAAYREFAARQPDTVAVDTRFDEALSHRVMAGADFFLMPSRTEPCGLTQMYAQVYGTVPLASSVGGLVDTVIDLDAQPEKGTGIMFKPKPSEFLKALDRALRLFADKANLAAVQQRAMRQDFSWESVVGRYELLYNE
jgi:starch synthase